MTRQSSSGTGCPGRPSDSCLGPSARNLRRATRRSFALTPKAQFLAALRFYATGSFLQVVGNGQDLSKASVSRWVQEASPRFLDPPRVLRESSASPPSVGWLQPPGKSGGCSETVGILLGLTSSHQWLTRYSNIFWASPLNFGHF